MENKQKPAESERSSICSDLEQMNMADFALDEFEAKPNDGTAGEIEKIKAELAELKKEMEAMKLASKADSNEISSKLGGKIDRLEKYFDEKMVANEKKIGNLDMEIGRLINGMENVKKMMEEKPNESMKEKLAKTEEEMAKLKEEIDQKDHKLAEHEAKIESLEEQISSQDKILEKRGAKICTLEEEIGQKDEKLAEKVEEICTLIEEIGQKDEKLAEKVEEICALKEEIDELKKEIGQKVQQLDEKELKIYKLEYEIEQQDEKLTSKICELQREIGTLEEEIGQKDQKLEEKDEEIYSLEEKTAYLRGKMEEKEAKIGALENEIDGQKAKIGQKDQKLVEKEAKIGLLKNEIAKHKKVMVDLQSIIANAKIDQHSPIHPTNSSNAKPTKAPTTTTNSSNLYGYCAGCEQAFLQTDWARQVGDLYYHAGCFKCDHCRLQFLAGEEFGQDFKIQHKNRSLGKMVPRILCKKDYMELVVEKESTQVVNAVKVSDPGTKYPYVGSTWQIYDRE